TGSSNPTPGSIGFQMCDVVGAQDESANHLGAFGFHIGLLFGGQTTDSTCTAAMQALGFDHLDAEGNDIGIYFGRQASIRATNVHTEQNRTVGIYQSRYSNVELDNVTQGEFWASQAGYYVEPPLAGIRATIDAKDFGILGACNYGIYLDGTSGGDGTHTDAKFDFVGGDPNNTHIANCNSTSFTSGSPNWDGTAGANVGMRIP